MTIFERIRTQYEKFPYPSIPLFARMRAADSHLMNYESGMSACFGDVSLAVERPKILVAGCGTFEPYVVALANQSAEITCLDFSARALKKLKWRLRLHFPRRKFRYVCSSIETIPTDLGPFHMIVATGVLHHLEKPEFGLKILENHLEKMGVMRIMLYSKHGRHQIYKIRALAQALEITNGKKLRKIVSLLPPNHPMKSQFYLYSDIQSEAGIRDGFLNVIDRPLDAIDGEKFLATSGLKAQKFLHTPGGSPERFDSLRAENFCERSDWEKIAALDRVSELENNFIFWCARIAEISAFKPEPRAYMLNPALKKFQGKKVFSKLLGEAEIVPVTGKVSKEKLPHYTAALWMLPASRKPTKVAP